MADPDPAADMIGTLILSVLFLLFSIILSVGDASFVAVGDTRLHELEEGGDSRAARIRRMITHERRFSGRIHAGLYLNALFVASFVLYDFSGPLTDWISRRTNLSVIVGNGLAVAILAVLTAFVLTAFGHMLPRRLSLINPEKTARAIVPLFSVLYAVLWPLDALCRLVISPFLRIMRINPHDDTEKITEDDIRELMDAGEEVGTIEGTQKDMVNNIFAFDDITAAVIMTPRTDVVAVEINEPIISALQESLDNGYSRIPVYENDIDHIIGILYIKDLLGYVGQSLPTDVTLRHFLRETHFVPDTKKCDELFEEMNEKHLQMAIVVDEYGGVAGIVTMEDLLESIVGNMQDEFDNETEEVTKLDENSFVVDGSLSIGELEELLDTDLPEGDYDTVAGFLMDQLGHIPDQDEQASVPYKNFTFIIQQMDDRRIEQILIRVDRLSTAEENE